MTVRPGSTQHSGWSRCVSQIDICEVKKILKQFNLNRATLLLQSGRFCMKDVYDTFDNSYMYPLINGLTMIQTIINID